MSTTEELLDEARLELYRGIACEGADLVGVSIDDAPSKIMEAVNLSIAEPDHLTAPTDEGVGDSVDNWSERALPIGALWGQTMVRHFGWHWATLIQHDHDNLKVTAVVNQDRSLVIYPFH